MVSDVSFLGAVASGAGDDFHEKWVARELLRMLDPNSNVRSIKVEGVPTAEAHAELGELAQAVDVALTMERGAVRAYRYLQMKYSPSHPDTNWTWARLTAPKTKSRKYSSVLGKLARLMHAVDFEGEFAIVTNQPISSAVVNDINKLLSNGDRLPDNPPEIAATLMKRLGLKAPELIRFLRAWDLGAFGSVSRLQIETEIVRRLAGTTDADARDDAAMLQTNIRQFMLPEGGLSNELTRETLLVWLGAGANEIFFPAPSRISPPDPLLDRPVAACLVAALRKGRNRPLRILADGGCGKTSLVSTLQGKLPQGSEVLIYDCYGGGLFLASDQRRHLPEHAFTQLGNELAARLATPFVIRRNGSLRAFDALRRRVISASEIIAARDPDALLVLCFDAVDNARIGANHWVEPCFLDDLAAASGWPSNVRIVVTCRNARRDAVGAADLFDDFAVSAFDLDECQRLIELAQPGWHDSIADTLHDLTGGNPRRLSYALDGLAAGEEDKAIARLLPRARGIDPLFEKLVQEAGIRIGGPSRIWPLLSALARLPRPVPTAALAAITELEPADVADAANDVGGIVLHPNGWSFHDEDFEAFVDEHTRDSAAQLLKRSAEILAVMASTDRYAAEALGEVFVSAGQLDALYALVAEQNAIPPTMSAAETEFVRSRRLALALRACRHAEDIGRACTLLIASAEATKRQKILDDLIVQNLDLSVRFERDAAMRLVMTGRRYSRLRARLRVELAASSAAHNPSDAKGHYRWWKEYLRESRSSDATTSDISASDVAADVLTHTIIHGDAAGLERFQQWHPLEQLLPAFLRLAHEAAGLRPDTLREAISAKAWPPCALAPLVACALLSGCTFAEPTLREALDNLAGVNAADWADSANGSARRPSPLDQREAVLFLCERAAAELDLHPAIRSILAAVFPSPILKDASDLYSLRTTGATHARVLALIEILDGEPLNLEKWLPPVRALKDSQPRKGQRPFSSPARREKSDEERWNETRSETLEIFGRMLGAARVTRDLAVAVIAPEGATESFSRAFNYPRSYGARPRETDAAALLVKNHLFHSGLAGIDLAALRTSVTGSLKSWYAANDHGMLDIAEALVLLPAGHDAALDWLVEIAHDIETEAGPSSERAKLLARCARAALPIDSNLARGFFEAALVCTEQVDFEALAEIAACRALAEAGLGGDRAERVELARRIGDAAGQVVATLDLHGDFPWDSMACAVAAADISTGLAAISRLQDVGIANFEQTLPTFLTADCARRLTPAQRYALALLSDDCRPQVTQMFRDDKVPEAVFAAELRERLLLGSATRFFDALNDLSMLQDADASPAVAIAEKQRHLLLALNPDAPVPLDDGDEGEEEEETSAGDAHAPELTTQDEIFEALEPIRSSDRGSGQVAYIALAARIRKRALRVPFLELALAAAGDQGDLGMALPEILERWSNYPPVRHWATERIGGYVALSLHNLFEWRYEDTSVLDRLLRSTGLSQPAQINIVLEAIAHNAETITAELIFALVGVVARRSPADTRNGLLARLLQRVTARTTRSAEMTFSDINAPEDPSQAVARVLFAAMADVDKRVRWRAAHAALLLIDVDDPAVEPLVAQLMATDEKSFAGADFYRYAAREQLMTTLWRATLSAPLIVARHAPVILACLRSDPHLVVRELGKLTLRELMDAERLVLSADDDAYVDSLNRSQFPPAERTERALRPAAFHEETKKRPFHFDTMDTIRYWYQSPADLFDMGMEDFLDQIEAWVHGRWGYCEEASHWLKEPRLERIRAEERHVSNRQGHRPIVERLSHYLEWHGMMCAMGELIDTRPLAKPGRYGDGFDEWLHRSLPSDGPAWLSDLRTPAPFERRFWGYPPVGDVADPEDRGWGLNETGEQDPWVSSIVPEVFDNEVDVGNGQVVIAADYDLRWRDRAQPVDIRSALVSPETAMSLGQSLLTAHDRMDFLVPATTDHSQIEEEGFELTGWLRFLEPDEGSDRRDMRRGSVAGMPILPDGPIASAMGLVFQKETSRWTMPGGEPAIELTMWGDDENRHGSGWRATAHREFLQKMLSGANKSLLIYVETARRRPQREGGKTSWALYVLDQQNLLHRIERTKRGLGPWLIRREGMKISVDTLGRWLLHRAAELEAKIPDVSPKEAARLRLEIEKICDRFREGHGRSYERF